MNWPLPLWIAHRGAGKLAPENTLAAFRLGAAHGFCAFECDVKLSAEGVPFLLHDDTLDRTTNARGVAGERSWAALSQVDAGAWHSAAYAGEPMPSLAAVASYVRNNGFALNLEIKPTTGQDHRTGSVVGRECLRWWPETPRALLLSSFQPEALHGAREAAPELPRALLLDSLPAGWWEMVISLDCAAVVTNHRLMDAPLLQRLHAAGLRGLCYTPNDTSDVQRLLTLGIDGIITDAVDRFAPAPSTSTSRSQPG
ncbi:MAG: glycerophosphodiester phosphodiesterase [Pseudomonadota bacterium]|nr:glycerophosphodiester phosphodiesterase [Pseudomonadota bacterium]